MKIRAPKRKTRVTLKCHSCGCTVQVCRPSVLTDVLDLHRCRCGCFAPAVVQSVKVGVR